MGSCHGNQILAKIGLRQQSHKHGHSFQRIPLWHSRTSATKGQYGYVIFFGCSPSTSTSAYDQYVTVIDDTTDDSDVELQEAIQASLTDSRYTLYTGWE